MLLLYRKKQVIAKFSQMPMQRKVLLNIPIACFKLNFIIYLNILEKISLVLFINSVILVSTRVSNKKVEMRNELQRRQD